MFLTKCLRKNFQENVWVTSLFLAVHSHFFFGWPLQMSIMKSTLSAEVISLASKVIFNSSIKSSTGWSPSVFLPVKFLIFLSRGKTTICFCPTVLDVAGDNDDDTGADSFRALSCSIASSYFLVSSSKFFFNSSADMMIRC